jgi:hypothetical protein
MNLPADFAKSSNDSDSRIVLPDFQESESLKKLEATYHHLKIPSLLPELLEYLESRYQQRSYFPVFDPQGRLFNYVYCDFAPLLMMYLHTGSCHAWGMPDGMLTINEFCGHWCVALDFRGLEPNQEPSVVYIDFNGFADLYGLPVEWLNQEEWLTEDDEWITEAVEGGSGLVRLADSLEEFVSKLLLWEEIEALAAASPHKNVL